jgi:hypothetical protein
VNRDDVGCFFAGIVLLAATWLAGLIMNEVGRRAAHDEFTECRALLATADSATVHRTMPQCHKWTLPPRDAAKGEG